MPDNLTGLTYVPTSGATITGPSQSPIQSTDLSNASSAGTDLRVRLGALYPQEVYGQGIASILNETSGMLFPYSPAITLSQTVDYVEIALVHSNTNYQGYTRTPSVKISVTGKFTVQNQREGLYALAAIHFLRTASKSHFGENDPQAGLPPPVLLFSGYGNYMFGMTQVGIGGLRVILNSHSWAYDENIDTIDINYNYTPPMNAGTSINSIQQQQGGIVKLPSLFTIQCELTVIQTPTRMRQKFTFDKFASGQLMQNSDGWI